MLDSLLLTDICLPPARQPAFNNNLTAISSFKMHQLTDNDAITIGKQIWTNRNLNVTTFRNGDPIFEAKNDEEWRNASNKKQPVCACLNFDSNTAGQFGRFYNGYAVNDPRGLAPEGWHIPTDAEYREVIYFLKEGWAGEKMKSTTGWYSGNGTNESGFNGLPAGYCTSTGFFAMQRTNGFWWGSSLGEYGWQFTLGLVHNSWHTAQLFYEGGQGQSVRCIKD